MSQLYFNQTINRIAYVIIRHTYRQLLELRSSCSLPIEYRQNNSSLRTSSLRSSRHRAWTHSCLLAIRPLGGSLIGIQDVEGFTPFLSCSNHRETHVFFQLAKRFIPVQKKLETIRFSGFSFTPVHARSKVPWSYVQAPLGRKSRPPNDVRP